MKTVFGKYRLLLTACVLLLTAFYSTAQNNVYEIDDECFEWFSRAEAAIGTPEFEAINAQFLASALEKRDEKARTLYYVEKLKNATRQKADLPDKDGNVNVSANQAIIEAAVMQAFDELKTVSRETGYKQYYYYAYSLVRNYFYNSKQLNKAMEIVLEMRNVALDDKDEYGQWVGDRYLVNLYLAQSDYLSAKKYLPEIIRIYETTDDETISRQAICETFIDYADCFPVGSDSMRVYIDKACQSRKGMADSAICTLYLSVMSLLDRDMESYKSQKEYTLSSTYGNRISSSLPQFYAYLDAVVDGSIGMYDNRVGTLVSFREMRMLTEVARSWGYYRTAYIMEHLLSQRMELKVSQINEMNLAELEARYGLNLLNADLEEKNRQISRIRVIAVVLFIAILLTVISFLLLHIRTLGKSKRKDEKMIQDLTEANEKVRLADEAKTRFIQNMSHELRTPLNAITGFSQLLSLPDGTFPEDEKEEFSNHIINNTKMLTMLLDDILNSSAMDSGGYRITVEDAECGTICRSALSSAEHRLQPGVSLEYVADMELPYHFRTDPMRVQQVLTNMLTNACKHTSSGGIVLRSSIDAEAGVVVFSVEDTGPGVPPEQAGRIFERFVKLNDFVQGTGLGLSICRDIATRLGGTIYLDTSYTRGARFVFSVPVTMA